MADKNYQVLEDGDQNGEKSTSDHEPTGHDQAADGKTSADETSQQSKSCKSPTKRKMGFFSKLRLLVPRRTYKTVEDPDDGDISSNRQRKNEFMEE